MDITKASLVRPPTALDLSSRKNIAVSARAMIQTDPACWRSPGVAILGSQVSHALPNLRTLAILPSNINGLAADTSCLIPS